jgi:DNA-binding YbaB/EbfC family protein
MEFETMKDLGGLMKQAQAMQQKLLDAQARIADLTAEGTSGGGMVTVTLKGTGELAKVVLDTSLIEPGEGEVIADLIVAAHAVAKTKLDAQRDQMMQEAAGPMAGMMGGLPGMKF